MSDKASVTGQPDHRATQRGVQIGVLCAISAHVMWGLFPLYWRQLDSISAATLTAHRVIWSFTLLAALAIVMPRLRKTATHIRDLRSLMLTVGAAFMVGLNWCAFMYAVNTDQVLQASLGYYINPLLNVLLGVVVLGERLRRFQWLAVGSAAIGVGVMAVAGSGVPWIALTMAGAFATYGLLKKMTHVPPLEGLVLETGILFPFAITFVLFQNGTPSMASYDGMTWTLLLIGGLVTITPLALFAVAAKRVTLSTIGILQYVGPTLQWFVGVVVLGEAFGGVKMIGFVFVWIGVIVFVVGSLMVQSYSGDTIQSDATDA